MKKKSIVSLMIMVLFFNLFNITMGYDVLAGDQTESFIEESTDKDLSSIVNVSRERDDDNEKRYVFSIESMRKDDYFIIAFPKLEELPMVEDDGKLTVERVKDGYKYIAKEDIKDVKGALSYKYEEDKTNQGGGGSSVVIVPNKPSATDQKWEHYRNDKMGYVYEDEPWDEVNYSISINFDEATQLKDFKKIKVKDITDGELMDDISVRYYTNVNGFTSHPIEELTYKITNKKGDRGFEIELDTYQEHQVTGIDIIYKNKIQNKEDADNRYEIWTTQGRVVSGGYVDGVVLPPEIMEPETPQTPDTPEECPVCDNCDEITKEKDETIKEKEDKIKDLEKIIKEQEDKIKELENKEPIVVEKIIEVPHYYTEIRIEKIIETVIEKVEVPHYYTELRIEKIVEEVIKEVKVPYYITEIKWAEKPCSLPMIPLQPSKPTERPKEEPKEEDVVDYPTIDQGVPINPIPPVSIPKDEEDFTLIPSDDNNVVEREVDEEEIIEDGENIAEDDVVKEEDREDNNVKKEVKVKFDEDKKDKNQEVNKEENKEKQHKLPATGQSRNVAIFIIGVTLLIYGITLKRRG